MLRKSYTVRAMGGDKNGSILGTGDGAAATEIVSAYIDAYERPGDEFVVSRPGQAGNPLTGRVAFFGYRDSHGVSNDGRTRWLVVVYPEFLDAPLNARMDWLFDQSQRWEKTGGADGEIRRWGPAYFAWEALADVIQGRCAEDGCSIEAPGMGATL